VIPYYNYTLALTASTIVLQVVMCMHQVNTKGQEFTPLDCIPKQQGNTSVRRCTVP